MKVLCLGSFDPVTSGHFDYISRAASLFDRVCVGVAVNSDKNYIFSREERAEFLKLAFKDFQNVEIVFVEGFAADAVKATGSDAILKSARNSEDFSYEAQIASLNRSACEVESVMLFPSPEFAHVSSTGVRELLKYGKSICGFVPEGTEALIRACYDRKGSKKL